MRIFGVLVILAGLAGQVLICDEGPLSYERFPWGDLREWVFVVAYALPMMGVGLGLGLIAKVIPAGREQWLWPLALGAWLGVLFWMLLYVVEFFNAL